MDLTVYVTIVDCIFKSVKGQDIQNPCKTCGSAEAKHEHEFNWINYECVLLEEKSYAKYVVPCMIKKNKI
jgi:hypothetical protein